MMPWWVSVEIELIMVASAYGHEDQSKPMGATPNGRRTLSSAGGAGRDEDARVLAGEGALGPEAARRVPERLQGDRCRL